MGIVFDGHPNLERLLMPDDWEGHPLRKDYPIGGEPVRFSDARMSDRTATPRTAAAGRSSPTASTRARASRRGSRPILDVPPELRDSDDILQVNFGPNHPSTHGVLRLIVDLDGEEVVGVSTP